MGAELAFVIRQLRRELHVKTNNTSAAIRSSLHHMGAQSAAVYHRGGTAITSNSPVRMLARDCSQRPERLAAHSIGASPLRQVEAVHAAERNAHRLPRINGPDHSRAYTSSFAWLISRRVRPLSSLESPSDGTSATMVKEPHKRTSADRPGALIRRIGAAEWAPAARRTHVEFRFHNMKPCDLEYRFILATTRYAFFLKSVL